MVLRNTTETSVEIRFPGNLKSYYIAQFFKNEVQKKDVDWLYVLELYSSRIFDIETQRCLGNGDWTNTVFVAMVLAQSFVAEKIKNFQFYKDLEKKTNGFENYTGLNECSEKIYNKFRLYGKIPVRKGDREYLSGICENLMEWHYDNLLINNL